MTVRRTILALTGSFLALLGSPGAAQDRRIAITIDDLPGPPGGLVSNDVAFLRENTRKLLEALTAHGVPAVGFVNEGKLFVAEEGPAGAGARTDILKMWVDAGLELGNHSYSHKSLNRTPPDEFQADVLKGERITRLLLAEKGLTLRYFRHPFLQVGLDLDRRRAFEDFLRVHGYTIAPVTVDNEDYIYAALYADALRRGDRVTAQRVGAAYLLSMGTVLEFCEGVSEGLVGRPLRQVLLLHANSLNADYFGEVARLYEARGYRFVSLAEALEDEAYALADPYVGAWGISWLHHWEVGAGRKRTPSPDPPDWVAKAYEAVTR